LEICSIYLFRTHRCTLTGATVVARETSTFSSHLCRYVLLRYFLERAGRIVSYFQKSMFVVISLLCLVHPKNIPCILVHFCKENKERLKYGPYRIIPLLTDWCITGGSSIGCFDFPVCLLALRRNKSRKTQCYWSFLVLKRQTQFVQDEASNHR